MSVAILDIECIRQDLRVIKPKIRRRMTQPDLTKIPKTYTTEEKIANWKKGKLDDFEVDFEKKVDDAGLLPEYGNICVIGIMTPYSVKQLHGDESENLKEAWEFIHGWINSDKYVCGWNLPEFDIHYMVKRSFINHIPVPRLVFDSWNYKYFNKKFIDLMGIYNAGKKGYTKLSIAAEDMGLREKMEIGDMTKTWKTNPQKVLEYNLRDLELELEAAKVFSL